MFLAIRLLPAVAGVVLFSAMAVADVKAVYHADGKESSSLAVKGHLVRWTFTDPRGQQAMMYDNERKVMTVIDHAQKQIVEMNEASLEAMRQRIQAMRAQMRAQLRSLPPEQRKMIERRIGAGSAKTKVVAKKGKKDRIGGYPCRHYDMLVDGKSEQQVCVAALADAGVSATDYKTLEGMFDFMQKMAESQGAGSAPFANSIKGIPVRMKEQRTGRVQTVKSISSAGLPDSLFTIPDYKRVDPFAPPKR